ncbi:MAG: GNAT family N-acetyltransferase [Anaerolineae bacterium]
MALEEAVLLKGKKVFIRPMKLKDVELMCNWPPFTDLLASSNFFLRRSPAESEAWFNLQVSDPTRLLYAIDDLAGNLIGRLSLREIKRPRSARLGITLRPDRMGQGYGTDAICTFLAHFFEELGFASLYLDVAAANQRAVRCYKKCGFRYVGSHYSWAGTDSQLAFLEKEENRHLRRFFRRKNGNNLALFYDMKIDRADWEKLKAGAVST